MIPIQKYQPFMSISPTTQQGSLEIGLLHFPFVHVAWAEPSMIDKAAVKPVSCQEDHFGLDQVAETWFWMGDVVDNREDSKHYSKNRGLGDAPSESDRE